MATTSKRRLLLMEARRFTRASLDRVKQVHDATEEYALPMDEALKCQQRALVWLDELIEDEEREGEDAVV